MATTEIEKLERRYAENPQGLTFAPLAEVHRKNGDIPRALELLRTGLELHPNYIPASIVLGRCHWDQGDLPAAEAAFSHVLRLDDENVIALKSLADISERLGRGHEAQRWLNRLITIDRSNEEARQHLARLEAAKGEPPATPAAPSTSAASAPESKREAPAPAAKEVASPAAYVHPTTAPEIPPLDLTAAIAEPAAAAPSNKPEQPTSAQPPKTPAFEFLDTSESAKDAEETTAPSEEPAPFTRNEIAHGEEPAAPVTGLISQEFVPPKEGGYRLHPELTQEFGAAIEPPDTLEVETAEELELQSSGAAEFRVPNAAEEFMDAARPAEPVLAPILEPVTPRVEPPSRPPEPTRLPSYSVRNTQGQSVASFFRSLLAARPSGTPTTSSPAQQDRKAPDGPSPGAGEDAEPNPPTVSAAGNAPDAAVSFDDFFGTAGETNAPKGSSKAGEDDLDQFQSWLQNLKR